MQARIKEITERMDNYSCEDSEFIINSKHDILFLLYALDQAQEENKHARIANKECRKNNAQLRDRERVLREALEEMIEKTNEWYGGLAENVREIAEKALAQEGKRC